MTNSIDKSVEDILIRSMKNAFIGREEVVEEVEPTLKEELAAQIAEERVAREDAKVEMEKVLAEKVLHKSEKATTSDEKQKEITEKSVKNTITINPDLKEDSIVARIYSSYNNKYLSEKQYTLTNADKKGNTPAWQNRNKKNVKTGEPLYKKADHMKEGKKRWQDDDGDGKWYEKSDVDGKISKREKEAKKKK